MRIILAGLLFIAFVFCNLCYGQNARIDSIKSVLTTQKEDSNKVNSLLVLSKEYFNSNPDQSLSYATEAKELSQKIDFKSGLAYAYKNSGIAFFNKGLYLEAIQQYEISLNTFDSIGDKKGVANMYSNMGNIYYNKGDDVKALELYLKSLKISEDISDTLRIVTALINIGTVYSNKKATYDKALEYLRRAYPMSININNDLIGAITVNIGEIYLERDQNDSALYYFERSLKAYEGSENVPYTLNDIGRVYVKKKEYDKAIEYQQRAYEIASGLGARNDMAISLIWLAGSYLQKGDTKLALKNYLAAENLSKETGANLDLKKIYEGLSRTYAKLGDFSNAFRYQDLLISIKDTIYNTDTDKKLGTLQFTFDIEKKQGEINLLVKDQQLKEKEISRQKLVRNSFIGGFTVVLLFAGIFLRQKNRIAKEKKRSDELLLNILPEETAEELKATGTAKAKSFDSVTVMFTDFKNFTQAAEKLSAEELVSEINYCYSEFDKIVTKYGIEKIKTIGDAYMCAGGLPAVNSTHPVDVIKAGLEMQAFIAKNKAERIAIDQPYFELRLGVHTGPVVAGIVGIKKFAYDIWGDTVNTASRMESSGETGKVNISGDTYEIIKGKFNCTHRGKIKAKNKGEIDMYFVEGIAI